MLAAGLDPAAAFQEQLGRTLRSEIGLRPQLRLDSPQASKDGSLGCSSKLPFSVLPFEETKKRLDHVHFVRQKSEPRFVHPPIQSA
jgi:hypothetical protein